MCDLDSVINNVSVQIISQDKHDRVYLNLKNYFLPLCVISLDEINHFLFLVKLIVDDSFSNRYSCPFFNLGSDMPTLNHQMHFRLKLEHAL